MSEFDAKTTRAWKKFIKGKKKLHPNGFSGVQLEEWKFEFWKKQPKELLKLCFH